MVKENNYAPIKINSHRMLCAWSNLHCSFKMSL